MYGGKRPLGYTIVEVMIVLAVTGLMFVVAGNFISQKQVKTTFTAGVNELSSQIQDTIDQVNSGRYTDKNFSCSGGASLIFSFDASREQGSNQDCIFLGKFMHFQMDTGDDFYETFSLAGRQPKTVLSLATVQPTPIISGDGKVDLTVQHTVPQRLNVTSVKYADSTGAFKTTYGLGITQGLGVPSGGGGYATGAQTISLVYSPKLSASATKVGESGAQALITNSLDYTKTVKLCISDGTRFAILTVGGNGGQLGVQTTRTDTDCT